MLTAESLARWMPRPRWTAICAVSGGLDSMCLLHLLHSWCQTHGGQLAAAHFNHCLRSTAARDEEFVRHWCADHGIVCAVERGNVRACAKKEGLSMEEAARKLRYAFLRREAERRKEEAQSAGLSGDQIYLYTAHHLNDSAETVLLNLIRGTGIRGLTGVERCRDGIVRPLLDVTRPELEAYAAAHGVPHVEDETNADPDAAARNLLRLRVMPLLRQINPKAEEHIHAAAGQLRIIDRSLEADARERTAHMEVRNGRVTLSVRALREASGAVQPRMLLCALDKLGVGRKDYGAVHLNAVWKLWMTTDHGRERRPEPYTGSGRVRRLDLPHGVTARYQRGWLILETRPQPLTEVELLPGQPLRWGEYTLTLWEYPDGPPKDIPGLDDTSACACGIADYMREHGLVLRARRWHPDPHIPQRRCYEEWGTLTVAPCPPGERLTLPGAKGRRSVKRLCLDKRISLTERDGLPAIYMDGVLAAVWRLGVDAAFVPGGGAFRWIQVEAKRK